MKNKEFVYIVSAGEEEPVTFGSLSAIYDIFPVASIGVKLKELWEFGFSDTNTTFSNDYCVIYRSQVHRKSQKCSTFGAQTD